MYIEDQEAFKTWLTAVLRPICDAEPGALAKYVIALVKKDKTPEALRQCMISQLEVFLQAETEPFVNQLFKTLDTHDYITDVIPNANPPNPGIAKTVTPTTPPNSAKSGLNSIKQVIPVNEVAASITESINGRTNIKDDKKNDKDDKQPRRRSRHRSISRNRSRSRSWDRSRRSRSPRDKSPRDRSDSKRVRSSWRNKSPPSSSSRRHERRRSMSPGGGRGGRSRTRSPIGNSSSRHRSGRYRNRSPPASSQRSASRSRSRSNDRGREREPRKDGEGDGSDGDLRDVRTGSKRRCRDYDEQGYCMRGEMCPYDHGVDPVVLEDTALNRVLYAPNGAAIDNMIATPGAGVLPVVAGTAAPIMHMRPSIPPEYNPQAPQMWNNRSGGYRGGHRGGMSSGPRMPHMGFVPTPPGIAPPVPSIAQRELIPVPVLDTKQPPPPPPPDMDQPPPPPNPSEMAGVSSFKKKMFDFNRLGPRGKNANATNCSLELKKIPHGLNTISHLNNHFAKFGKIVNIQVSYDDDPEAAIITFSSHAEANAAYRSTEAVLNNRFIKVFWHVPEGKQENVPPQPNSGNRSIKDRLGQGPIHIVLPNTNKVLNLVQPRAINEKENALEELTAAEKEEIKAKKDEIKAKATAQINKNQELIATSEKLKKYQEEKMKEALKLTQDLRKRKQELLEKQLASQKLLIEKMEKCPPGAQRDTLLQTIKKSQESIEAIRKDLAQTLKPAAPTAPAPKKSKEEVQKELLDTELDLITKQAEGADTTELQKKLWELKAKVGGPPQIVAPVVIVPPFRGAIRGGMRGSARFNPMMGRHLMSKNNLVDQAKGVVTKAVNNKFQSHAVDHRPTRLLVSGYESDEKEAVITHFKQYGEIVDFTVDDSTPSVDINFKTRKEAEIAMTKGRHFQDRTLSITWSTVKATTNNVNKSISRTTSLVSEQEDDALLDTAATSPSNRPNSPSFIDEEELLQDDEEEEEENEDRSWRR